ncbi:hypothetical protein RBA41_05155 [Massilia sp. CCM 9210]|uniref:hypothetical protein n=1 Tax=Massilia scottii TaxID=3057166 RepID=UPI002796409E|nr:hypothetical protein [Massilia sp. CCM 9210]MDQ1812687.1 hypothetical protein [Massilia sp. CCM 9210]
MREHLFRKLLHACAPLLVWALHFFFCYVWVAALCAPGMIDGEAPRRWVVGMASALALGVCLWLAWRARHVLAGASEATRLLDWASAGSAVLAVAGVAWTSLPALMLDGCG